MYFLGHGINIPNNYGEKKVDEIWNLYVSYTIIYDRKIVWYGN